MLQLALSFDGQVEDDLLLMAMTHTRIRASPHCVDERERKEKLVIQLLARVGQLGRRKVKRHHEK